MSGNVFAVFLEWGSVKFDVSNEFIVTIVTNPVTNEKIIKQIRNLFFFIQQSTSSNAYYKEEEAYLKYKSSLKEIYIIG